MTLLVNELVQDPRVIWTEEVLRFADTDQNGHVNNSVFSVLCESGRVHLFASRLDGARPRDTFFVIARLAIDFRAELHYPGRVRTATWISRLGNSSIALQQAILSQDGTLAAQGESVCVLMDGPSRRPTPFPDGMRRAAEALLRPTAE